MDIDELQSVSLRESSVHIKENTMVDEASILCYFCDGIKTVELVFYSSTNFHSNNACRKCRNAKQMEEFKTCSKCKNEFSFLAFFYKKLGLTLPSICASCRKLKHYKCKECFLHKEINTTDFCTKCDETYIYKDCNFCKRKTKVFLLQDLDNVVCIECLKKFPTLANLDLVESISDVET